MNTFFSFITVIRYYPVIFIKFIYLFKLYFTDVFVFFMHNTQVCVAEFKYITHQLMLSLLYVFLFPFNIFFVFCRINFYFVVSIDTFVLNVLICKCIQRLETIHCFLTFLSKHYMLVCLLYKYSIEKQYEINSTLTTTHAVVVEH